MIQNCFSMRPGTLFGYKSRTWRVTSNNTLDQVFEAKTIQKPITTRRFRYPDNKEISIRWKPTRP